MGDAGALISFSAPALPSPKSTATVVGSPCPVPTLAQYGRVRPTGARGYVPIETVGGRLPTVTSTVSSAVAPSSSVTTR